MPSHGRIACQTIGRCTADPSLQWDESNLSMNQEERDNAEARMTIDEPKTPFVHSAPEPPMDEECM